MTEHTKKLIEVALPLEEISAACRADKNRKSGTIRSIHKWFAPMPSPAWDALLFAALVDDPQDDLERQRLLSLVKALMSDDEPVRKRAFSLAKQELARRYEGGTPIVGDPFCGGGSTVVEAQRLGLRSVASDLNPVATLITKCLAEYPSLVADHPPLHTDARLHSDGSLDSFAEDVRHYAGRVYEEAREQIGQFYPPGPNGDPVIAYRWARTVPSPDPSVRGAKVPIVRDWWLSKKRGEMAWMRPIVSREQAEVTFAVETSGSPSIRTTAGDGAYCLFSGAPIEFDYLRREGMAGRLGLSMMAIVTRGAHGKHYFAPCVEDLAAAEAAAPFEKPEVDLPDGGLGFRVQAYGVSQWWQMFTDRQNLALGTFADLVGRVSDWVKDDGGDDAYASAVASVLGLCIGKLAQFNSTLVWWKIDSRSGVGKAESAFGRNDLPRIWDFTETNPFGESVGDWMQVVTTALRALSAVDWEGPPSRVSQGDARTFGQGVSESMLIATDPPYFHYIGYADLSNYFYVWIRRALRPVHPDLFATLRAPTTGELIADSSRHDGDSTAATAYFIDGFTETFKNMLHVAHPDLPLLIVYAFKQQETQRQGQASTGWEAMLQALIDAGLAIVGTWPIHGTGSTRLRSQSSNSLASYVVLVCRPRSDEASPATRSELRTELRIELRAALPRLTSAGIAAVDLAQAAIGPGMHAFTRHSRVIEADGSSMTVRTVLDLVNQALDEILAEQEGEFEAATRWAIAWFEQFGLQTGDFGVAETLCKAKNCSVQGMVQDGFLEARAGKVRLLGREELSADWDPATDARLTVWEMTQHLLKRLDDGEAAAAALVRKLGASAEAARDLAYRLYLVCERKKWSQEGQAYNGLVVAWPQIQRLAASQPASAGPSQTSFEV